MVKGALQYWHCLNRLCGRIELLSGQDARLDTKFCACGARMKKQPQPIVFSYLDFLREEEIVEIEEGTRKE